jgi:HD-GYP domain-containing protein (c-di-GMP phosphodiesterase class II)
MTADPQVYGRGVNCTTMLHNDACRPPKQALYSTPGVHITAAVIIDRLKEISFFSDIPDHDLRQIAEIMVEKSYRKGSVIIEERTEAERFFIIYRGKIEITKKFESDEEFVLSVQSDGDFFGEMALLDEQPRSATARALEPTIVLETSRKNFETLLYKAPMLAYRITRELSSRLRETGALLVSHLQQRNRQLYHSHIDTITMVVQAIEKRATQTSGRTRRVAGVAKAIGRQMGLTDEQLMVLELSALLHDLGMLSVPESLLAKTGPLARGEYEEIKKHPRVSKEMIEGIPFLQKAAQDVLHHHERYNGEGYPKGLAGTSIPLASRILAVVDAFEAMTRGRPYRDRLGTNLAIEEIRKLSGAQFDPDVVKTLEELRSSKSLPDDDQA